MTTATRFRAATTTPFSPPSLSCCCVTSSEETIPLTFQQAYNGKNDIRKEETHSSSRGNEQSTLTYTTNVRHQQLQSEAKEETTDHPASETETENHASAANRTTTTTTTTTITMTILSTVLAVLFVVPVLVVIVIVGTVICLILISSYLACEALWFLRQRHDLLQEYAAHDSVQCSAKLVQRWETVVVNKNKAGAGGLLLTAAASDKDSSSKQQQVADTNGSYKRVRHVRLKYCYRQQQQQPLPAQQQQQRGRDDDNDVSCSSQPQQHFAHTVYKTFQYAAGAEKDDDRILSFLQQCNNKNSIPIALLPNHPRSGYPVCMLNVTMTAEEEAASSSSRNWNNSSSKESLVLKIFFSLVFAIFFAAVAAAIVRGLIITATSIIGIKHKSNNNVLTYCFIVLWIVVTMILMKVHLAGWILEPYLCNRVDEEASLLVQLVVRLTPDHERKRVPTWNDLRKSYLPCCLASAAANSSSTKTDKVLSASICTVLRQLYLSGQFQRLSSHLRETQYLFFHHDDGDKVCNNGQDLLYYCRTMDLIESVVTAQERRLLHAGLESVQSLDPVFTNIEDRCLEKLWTLEGRPPAAAAVTNTTATAATTTTTAITTRREQLQQQQQQPAIRDVGRRLLNDNRIPPSSLP